jgi:Cytochrome P460
MKRPWTLIALSIVAVALAVKTPQASPNNESSANLPVYTTDGSLKFPANYREWVYLTSGVDMSYSPNMDMGHSMFDNVFVNPEAYKAFLQTGTWPDKTMLVLEARMAGNKGSINKNGHFQTGNIMGREVHVKDDARFPGKWAFFNAEDGVTGKLLPREMDCYSCHEQHGAVDTTFVQFYPTLLEIAKKKNTLSAAYLKEEAGK